MQTLFANQISAPRYVSAIATEAIESKPAVATARLFTPRMRGSIAVARWTGNLDAAAYDLQIKRRAGTWRTLASRVAAKSKRIEGSPGEWMELRVRAHDVDGVAGPGSTVSRLVFPQ